MFCNLNIREIQGNISNENIWKNDMPLQFSHSRFLFWDISFQMEWSTKFVIYQSSFLLIILWIILRIGEQIVLIPNDELKLIIEKKGPMVTLLK